MDRPRNALSVRRLSSAWGAALIAAFIGTATVAEPATRISAIEASSYCEAMAAGFPDGTSAAAFLESYVSEPGQEPRAPALANTAFVYDNALAAIAFVACRRVADARRIADAFVAAVNRDRFYSDGRIRNAYRAGLVVPGPLALNGWWNFEKARWIEDTYQAGTATGNAAWAALALLTVFEATGEPTYRAAAARVMSWVSTLSRSAGGFPGGFDGHEPSPIPLIWKSTEHNIDAFAACSWLATAEPTGTWQSCAEDARAFVAAMFDPDAGRFRIGTKADGRTPETIGSGLDAQLWPILAFGDSEPAWRRALAWAEENHGVAGGFDFNDDRDGIWIEGTSQAALVYKALGMSARADALLLEVAKDRAPGGLLYATRAASLTTGLASSSQSKSADFVYRRLPHLGATAWAALATAGFNPLTGRSIGKQS